MVFRGSNLCCSNVFGIQVLYPVALFYSRLDGPLIDLIPTRHISLLSDTTTQIMEGKKMTAFFTALLQNLKRRPRLKSQEVPLQLEPALLRLANLAPPHFPKRFPDSGTGKKVKTLQQIHPQLDCHQDSSINWFPIYFNLSGARCWRLMKRIYYETPEIVFGSLDTYLAFLITPR